MCSIRAKKMHLGRFFVREFDFDRRTILEPTLGLAELDGTTLYSCHTKRARSQLGENQENHGFLEH